MPLKLAVGWCRKKGDSNFGSRGASILLEVEVDSGLMADPVKLQERIGALYALARNSVETELKDAKAPTGPSRSASPPPQSVRTDRKNDNHGANADAATGPQINAIRFLARKYRFDLNAFLRERFQRDLPEDLTLKQASQVIDRLQELKSNPAERAS